jgi:hypothetical protein
VAGHDLAPLGLSALVGNGACSSLGKSIAGPRVAERLRLASVPGWRAESTSVTIEKELFLTERPNRGDRDQTDSELQCAVVDELKWEPSVNATHIGSVENLITVTP